VSRSLRETPVPEPQAPVGALGRLLQAHEVADLLAVPVTWVREATRAGRLPHIQLGRYVRYEREALLAWLAEQSTGRPPRPSVRPDGQPAR
jgi:excisionase family DNA binding protein